MHKLRGFENTISGKHTKKRSNVFFAYESKFTFSIKTEQQSIWRDIGQAIANP